MSLKQQQQQEQKQQKQQQQQQQQQQQHFMGQCANMSGTMFSNICGFSSKALKRQLRFTIVKSWALISNNNIWCHQKENE